MLWLWSEVVYQYFSEKSFSRMLSGWTHYLELFDYYHFVASKMLSIKCGTIFQALPWNTSFFVENFTAELHKILQYCIWRSDPSELLNLFVRTQHLLYTHIFPNKFASRFNLSILIKSCVNGKNPTKITHQTKLTF